MMAYDRQTHTFNVSVFFYQGNSHVIMLILVLLSVV